MLSNCKNCGAPLNWNRAKCEYCSTQFQTLAQITNRLRNDYRAQISPNQAAQQMIAVNSSYKGRLANSMYYLNGQIVYNPEAFKPSGSMINALLGAAAAAAGFRW